MQDPRSDGDFNLFLHMDPRYFALARNLVTHSTHIEKGENVLIHSFDIPEEMTIALPFVLLKR